MSLVLIFGIAAIVITQNNKEADEELRLALYDKESRELIVKKQNLQLEYANVEKYTLNRIADASYLGIVFTELDKQLFDHVYPMFANREIPLVGMMCLSKDQLPGGEGLITRAEYDIIRTAGWDTALYWDGEGILREYIVEMKQLFSERNLEFPKTIVFASQKYAIEYDRLLKEHGFLHVIHHGEGNLSIVDRSVDDALWHPGMISWNTKGVSNDLLSNLIITGGVTMFEVNFSGGNEILFDFKNSARVAAFNRMLNVIEGCALDDELVVTDIENAKKKREFYLQAKEESQEDIAARKAEILVEIDKIDAEITAIYNKYHS